MSEETEIMSEETETDPLLKQIKSEDDGKQKDRISEKLASHWEDAVVGGVGALTLAPSLAGWVSAKVGKEQKKQERGMLEEKQTAHEKLRAAEFREKTKANKEEEEMRKGLIKLHGERMKEEKSRNKADIKRAALRDVNFQKDAIDLEIFDNMAGPWSKLGPLTKSGRDRDKISKKQKKEAKLRLMRQKEIKILKDKTEGLKIDGGRTVTSSIDGLNVGDTIVEINGRIMEDGEEIETKIKNVPEGEYMVFTYEPGSSQIGSGTRRSGRKYSKRRKVSKKRRKYSKKRRKYSKKKKKYTRKRK